MSTIQLKALRELNNYSQEYMAEKLGISQSYYSKIENSRVSLLGSLIIRIMNTLGIKQLHPAFTSENDVLSSLDREYELLITLNNKVIELDKRIKELELYKNI